MEKPAHHSHRSLHSEHGPYLGEWDGKELVARAVHLFAARQRPFVSINCGAFPETLLESELFGYVKGAFTGATQNKRGLFEVADGGTIFLDEIGEMSLTMQVKLLRVLQERSVRPVGGTDEIAIDVRVLAATNRDLERQVTEKPSAKISTTGSTLFRLPCPRCATVARTCPCWSITFSRNMFPRRARALCG
jgi:transcriptional regulator with AAA-type ATPase domain